MNPSQFFDEYLCWKAEILGVAHDDKILVAEYVRIEFVTTKPWKRKRRDTPIEFVHSESDQEFPMVMVPAIEESIAENIFQEWLRQRMDDKKAK